MKNKFMRGWVKVAAPVAAATLLVAFTAPSATASGPAEKESAKHAAAAAAAVMTMDQLYKGTYASPPTTAPAGAKGKKVWWISCSQAVTSCSDPAKAAGEVAKILGIDFHVADGKFNVGGAFNTAVRTALAAKPDALMLYGVACEAVRGALLQAKAQKVLIMGVETPDCATGQKMFSVEEKYNPLYPNTVALWKAYGAFAANYIINKNKNAKIIETASNGAEPLQRYVTEGFESQIKSGCPTCQIVAKVPYDSSALTPNGPWIQGFRAALVQHPEANAAYLPWDVLMTALGGAQAVQETGRPIVTFGGQAASDGLEFLRAGKVTALTTARDPIWSAWAAMDTINRALQGKPVVYQGIGFQLVTKDRNMPKSGPYVPPIDFKKIYLKAWNGGRGTM